jgi:hypothetical protein
MDDLEGQHRKVTKSILLAQLFLESIDDLKTTQYYKQDVKRATNNLEKKLERFLILPNQYLMGEAEDVMMRLSRGAENILNQTLEDIYEQDSLG